MTGPEAGADIVRTSAGLVAGRRTGGVRHFLSLPYAAPPVGPNRFALPQPVAAWDSVREAQVAGPSAPQRVKPYPGIDVIALVGDGSRRGDDYLTLNVWAPEEAQGRPVMVWIHGGGFVAGSKDAPVQTGAAFARSGVVCVAINYRLGVDGFLPIPGVPTNLGLRDMLAALRWVRDEIAAFGGDPDQVTLFGESAGAMAIADLLTSPLAAGLFRRAIVQSGHGSMVREIGVARRLVDALAKRLQIPATREGFAGVPIDTVLDAIDQVSAPRGRLDLRDANGHEPVFGISRFVPVIGDDVLPEHPLAALAKGAGAGIDLLIGTNAEEMNLYWVPSGIRAKLRGMLGRWMAQRIVSAAHPQAGALLRAYGLGGSGGSPGDIFAQATSDLVFRGPARRYAALHRGRTHMYEFDWRSPACSGALGACHALELPFVFDCLDLASGPAGIAGEAPPQALVDHIHALWVRFAEDGSLPWPAYDRARRQVYQLAAGEAVPEPPLPIDPFLS